MRLLTKISGKLTFVKFIRVYNFFMNTEDMPFLKFTCTIDLLKTGGVN